jgi:tetratricopeptide (TPR) repeat protein
LQPIAAEVLTALVWAIRVTSTNHRLILTCRYDFEFSQLRYFYKQPLEGMRGADLRKKCSRLVAFGAKSLVDEALKSQARRLADGNPRLLEWLDKILQNSTVDQVAILNRLEVDAVELREQVLAEALLQQMDETMGEMLSQGLVFELPVPREALTAVCENIPNLADYINRAVALGLLEVSPDESLRVPRILPLTLSTNVETLHQKGAEVLYRLWWEQGETSTEEERLEIHRLALLGKNERIAVNVANYLSRKWISQSRFQDTHKISQETLNNIRDYRMLSNLARVEIELGKLEKAVEYYQEALKICPDSEIIELCGIKHCLAYIKSKNGELDIALEMYQECLMNSEKIGHLKGKASALHEIAGIYLLQGKVENALNKYQECLEIQESESINDLQGQAATLHQIAYIESQIGRIQEALANYEKSFYLNESLGNLKGKISTLCQIASIKENEGNLEAVVSIFKTSLAIVEQIGSVELKAATFYNMAITYIKIKKFDLASNLLNNSLNLSQEMDDIKGQAITLTSLGQLLAYKQRDFVTALDYLEQSLKIFQRIKSPDAETVREIINDVQQMANS